MKTIKLKAEIRTLTGRKVKKLRAQKLIPVSVFGKNIKSIALQVGLDDFVVVHKKAGETQLVGLEVGNDSRVALISNLQWHPVTHAILHVDFYQVDLKEKVTAKVPLELVGEAPVVNDKTGVLLTLLDEVEVETLPGSVPEKIVIQVDGLVKVGDVILASALQLPDGVSLVTPPETELIRVDELVSKEAEELVEKEEAAKEAAQADVKAGEAQPSAPAADEKKI